MATNKLIEQKNFNIGVYSVINSSDKPVSMDHSIQVFAEITCTCMWWHAYIHSHTHYYNPIWKSVMYIVTQKLNHL